MKKFGFHNLKDRLALFEVSSKNKQDDFSLTSDEVIQELTDHHGNDRLLGRFTEQQVRDALTSYGVWKALADQGYPAPNLTIRSLDPFRQRLRIVAAADVPDSDDTLLCDLHLYETWLKGTCPVTGKLFEFDALIIDWLVFQNPNASFLPERPPLPGQRYPGLGIMRTSLRAILNLAKQIGKQAVVNIPEYYHNAVLYTPAFLFFNAHIEGRFRALRTFLAHRTLAEASHLVTSGKIRNDTKDESFVWKPHEQVLGLVPEVSDYFTSPLYMNAVQQAESESRFSLLD